VGVVLKNNNPGSHARAAFSIGVLEWPGAPLLWTAVPGRNEIAPFRMIINEKDLLVRNCFLFTENDLHCLFQLTSEQLEHSAPDEQQASNTYCCAEYINPVISLKYVCGSNHHWD
jgi:hypothetical protein